MRISAPATNELGLPLIKTKPFKPLSRSIRAIKSATSSANVAFSVFILSPGTSMVITPMPLSRMSSWKALFVSALAIILSPRLLLHPNHLLHTRSLTRYHHRDDVIHSRPASSSERRLQQTGDHKQVNYP